MDSNFDISTIKQYEAILGKDKIAALFEEYLKEHGDYVLKSHLLLENDKLENLRIIYHSLCSASLVFGMKTFAKACSKIEQDIIVGKTIDEIRSDVNMSKNIFDREITLVKEHLGVL
ncbi:MAG: hypothetical protein PHE89_00665 [Alphaproteobacteria bacterium]|nr:hypothetical protein [Alphaproteobacteria bacterium]